MAIGSCRPLIAAPSLQTDPCQATGDRFPPLQPNLRARWTDTGYANLAGTGGSPLSTVSNIEVPASVSKGGNKLPPYFSSAVGRSPRSVMFWWRLSWLV